VGHRHVDGDLVAMYVAGTLSPGRAAAITARVRGCGVCEDEVAVWVAVAGAMRARAAPGPHASPWVLDAALARVDAGVRDERAPVAGRWARHVLAVLVGQVPVLRRGIWAASALMFVLGSAVCLSRHSQPGLLLSLLAPLVAALGVCVIYGPQADPALEVTSAAPTSPRLVLLARLTLVAGYDLVLALAATGAVATLGASPAFWTLVSAWLGPLALLSALSLLLAVWKGPAVGAATAFAVWGLRVLSAQSGPAAVLSAGQAALITRVWGTSAPVLLAAGLLIGLTVFVAPHRARPA
jgi:hypothetical protein